MADIRRRGVRFDGMGLDGLSALGTEVTRPQSVAVLAETLAETGNVEEALALVTEALAMIERSGADATIAVLTGLAVVNLALVAMLWTSCRAMPQMRQ